MPPKGTSLKRTTGGVDRRVGRRGRGSPLVHRRSGLAGDSRRHLSAAYPLAGTAIRPPHIRRQPTWERMLIHSINEEAKRARATRAATSRARACIGQSPCTPFVLSDYVRFLFSCQAAPTPGSVSVWKAVVRPRPADKSAAGVRIQGRARGPVYRRRAAGSRFVEAFAEIDGFRPFRRWPSASPLTVSWRLLLRRVPVEHRMDNL